MNLSCQASTHTHAPINVNKRRSDAKKIVRLLWIGKLNERGVFFVVKNFDSLHVAVHLHTQQRTSSAVVMWQWLCGRAYSEKSENDIRGDFCFVEIANKKHGRANLRVPSMMNLAVRVR